MMKTKLLKEDRTLIRAKNLNIELKEQCFNPVRFTKNITPTVFSVSCKCI